MKIQHHARLLAIVLVITVLITGFGSIVNSVDSATMNASSNSEGEQKPLSGTSNRTVLAELFTNWDCGPCPYANHAINRLMDEYNPSELALVVYHMSWPGSDDPFYQDNTADNNARKNHYGVSSVPDMIFDGTVERVGGSSTTYDTYKPDIDSELANKTNLVIELSGDLNKTSGRIEVKVTATDPVIETNLKIRFQVVEDDKYAVGTNGEVIHRYVMRKTLSEESIVIVQGETKTFSREFSLVSKWDVRRLGVVVFVQSDTDKRVLQSAGYDFIEQPILLVDGDTGDTSDAGFDKFKEEMCKIGVPKDDWDINTGASDTSSNNEKGKPSLADLNDYSAVVWFTYNARTITLTTFDRNNISSYLDGRGNLFITGQDIGYDASTNGWLTWYQNYLHANYIADDAGTDATEVSGVGGDPISGGLNNLPIIGGYPSQIDPADVSSSTIFTYPRPNAIANAIDPTDNTGDVLADVQKNDTSGNSPSDVYLSDKWYTVDKGKIMFIDGFDTSPFSGDIISVMLKTEYSVESGYSGTNTVQWALDGGTLTSTGITPIDGEIDKVATYDLYSQGVDTLSEISTLDIEFISDDSGQADAVSFDYVWVEVTTTTPTQNAGIKADHDANSRVVYFAFNYFEGTDTEDADTNDETLLHRIISWLDGSSAPNPTIVQPNGGEILHPGQSYEIQWDTKDVNMTETPIDIFYCNDSASPDWILISSGEPNDGIYTWTVPSDNSTKCRIKVIATDSQSQNGEDVSDGDFTIGEGEQTFAIELVAGLNLISMPLNVTGLFDAQDLIDLINGDGGGAVSVSRWLAATGVWDTFNDGGASPFEIEVWEGYFINCNIASTWNAVGKIQESEPVDLVAGLTLIGASKDMGAGYDAQDLIDDINTDGGSAQAVSRWLAATGVWDTFNDGGASPFIIERGAGYFVNNAAASTWTP